MGKTTLRIVKIRFRIYIISLIIDMIKFIDNIECKFLYIRIYFIYTWIRLLFTIYASLDHQLMYLNWFDIYLSTEDRQVFAMVTKELDKREKLYAFLVVEEDVEQEREDLLMRLAKHICANTCRTDYVRPVLF